MADDSIHFASWWKYERYEISHSSPLSVIRPATQAKGVAYDPWSFFEANRGKYRKVNTLWGELAEIVRRLDLNPHDLSVLSPEGESLVLDWCNKYGLLGLLPASAYSITLPPVWERSETSHPVTVIQRRYYRTAGTWTTSTDYKGLTASEAPGSQWSPGEPLPANAIGKFRLKPPQTLYWDWEEYSWRTDEGNVRLSWFFSANPPSGQFPQPLSDDFWTVYQEPIATWVRVAAMFSEAIELVSRYAIDRYVGKEWFDDELDRVNTSLWRLNSLAAAESHQYEFGRTALKREWASASLLSAMAEMFLQDILARRRAFRCKMCQRIFVSNDPRSCYCSVRCRNTAQTNRYRQNIRRKAGPSSA